MSRFDEARGSGRTGMTTDVPTRARSMRVQAHVARAVLVGTMLAAGAGPLACGPDQPAKDPSSVDDDGNPKPGAAAPPREEEAPKWDSSSETASGGSSSASNVPATGSGSGSRGFNAPPTARRSDEYDKESTDPVLARAARVVKENCGQAKNEEGNAKGPWGETNVSVTLGHNGHTRGATIAAPYDGQPTGKCAVNAFLKLTFPPWSGADTTVDWPVELVQPGKDAKSK